MKISSVPERESKLHKPLRGLATSRQVAYEAERVILA